MRNDCSFSLLFLCNSNMVVCTCVYTVHVLGSVCNEYTSICSHIRVGICNEYTILT